jgi:4-azaleucine resistance transporter AzlC
VSPEIARGARLALPVVLGYLPLGFAFGVLAVKNNIPPLWAAAMSVFVYAGAGQLIAAGMAGAGAPVLSIVLTGFMVNLRHLLLSAALSRHVGSMPRFARALFALQMTDETFAVHAARFREGDACRPARLFACNVTAHLSWIAGSLLGVFSGGFMADVRPFGLDFALPAMFLGLLVPLCREWPHLAAALAAALFSVGFSLAGAGRWSVLIAAILASALGMGISLRSGGASGDSPAGGTAP